jgi:hypothetical protein
MSNHGLQKMRVGVPLSRDEFGGCPISARAASGMRHEHVSGFCCERENVSSRCKGKRLKQNTREAESIEAHFDSRYVVLPSRFAVGRAQRALSATPPERWME